MAKYSLRDNPLTEDPDAKLAQLEGVKSLNLDDIIERILRRGNTMTRTDLLAAINAYSEEIGFITEEGDTVNTPLINTSISITGVFAGGEDSFDPRRHAVKIHVTAGTALKEAAAKIKLTKVQGSGTIPWIVGVRDMLASGGGEGGTVRAGSVMELAGARLKFDAADAEQGVFLIRDGVETRLTQVVEAKPSRVLVMVPADQPVGSYTVELRTKYTHNKTDGKQVKRGSFEKAIVIMA